jgi:hypothetical protein
MTIICGCHSSLAALLSNEKPIKHARSELKLENEILKKVKNMLWQGCKLSLINIVHSQTYDTITLMNLKT